jgi:hypothetical protein
LEIRDRRREADRNRVRASLRRLRSNARSCLTIRARDSLELFAAVDRARAMRRGVTQIEGGLVSIDPTAAAYHAGTGLSSVAQDCLGSQANAVDHRAARPLLSEGPFAWTQRALRWRVLPRFCSPPGTSGEQNRKPDAADPALRTIAVMSLQPTPKGCEAHIWRIGRLIPRTDGPMSNKQTPFGHHQPLSI